MYSVSDIHTASEIKLAQPSSGLTGKLLNGVISLPFRQHPSITWEGFSRILNQRHRQSPSHPVYLRTPARTSRGPTHRHPGSLVLTTYSRTSGRIPRVPDQCQQSQCQKSGSPNITRAPAKSAHPPALLWNAEAGPPTKSTSLSTPTALPPLRGRSLPNESNHPELNWVDEDDDEDEVGLKEKPEDTRYIKTITSK